MEDKERPDFRYRTHINMTEPEEVYYWSKHFNVSPDQLLLAFQKAGTNKIKEIAALLHAATND